MGKPNLNIGDRLIDFSLPGVDGKQYGSSDFRDARVLALFFSCNHCPYVQAWEDRLIAVQADYADRGVRLVAINANDSEKYPEDSFPEMVERHRAKGMNFPYLHDETQKTAAEYGAERTPEFFVFDSDRILRYHGAPDDNCYEPENVKRQYLRDALDAILAGNRPSPDETPPVGCTIKWR